MAPRRARPAAETDAPASEVDVRLYTLADAEEGKARDDDGGDDDDDDDDDDDALTADPVRLPGTGEIDAAASATMSRIARVASRALDPLDAHEVDDSDSDGDSSSSDADRSDVDDPVADATMERIFATSRATPHDDAHDRSCDTRKNEEHVTRSDRATLESEMRKLRDERIAERAVSNGGGGGGGGGNGGGSGASSSDGSFRDLGPLATVAEDGDDHRREERADVAEETRRRTARAREDGGGGARGGGGGDVVARKRLASRSPASFVGLANFFNAGSGGSSNNASYSSVTSIGGGDGHSKHSPTQNPLPADVPVIRLRRTSSYFVADGSTGASSKLSSSICGCDGLDGGGGVSTEDIMRKRRNELITYRLRVAGFGKLCVTLLAGVLAGVVMWAMTTVTAKLTQLKFDKTRALLSSEDVATAWAYYAGVAMASVGATAFTVLHPRGCPMARGSGIPELKGYLNGNRQRGLFHWRTFLGRSVGVCLVIVATMPFGREGPSVHIGACVASMSLNLPWRKYLGWQPSPEERRQILQLGSAAGVAGAFNAPIGGLLYVMEEIASTLPPDYVWRAMITAGMAVGVAQVLYSANEGRVDYTSLVISDPNSSTGWDMSEIPLIVVLAVLAGALSALFTVAADFFGSVRRGKVRWVPTKMRAFLASKHGQLIDAVLSAALVASCQILIPLAYSCRAAPGEYDPYDPSTEAASGAAARSLQTVIQIPRTFVPYTCADGEFSEMATLMLQNEEGVVKHLFARDELYSEKLFTAPVVAAFLAYFFVIASVTTGGAFPAGVFIPNMLMGAALGRLFGFLAEWCVLSQTGPHTTASAW
jgi:chloride channel 7